jgi:hypothetical protein
MTKSFLTPKFVEHEVNDETLNFYPVSISTAFQIKEVLKPLARSLSLAMINTDGDRGYTDTRSEDGFVQTIVNPVSPEMAELRSKQKESAILDAIEALTERRSVTAIGRLIMDSLRDEFHGKKQEQKDVDLFMDSVDTTTLIQLLTGVAKANKRLFGPFGERIGEMIKVTMGSLEKTMEEQSSTLTNTGENSADSPIISFQEDTQ